jgi:hypothetical protein
MGLTLVGFGVSSCKILEMKEKLVGLCLPGSKDPYRSVCTSIHRSGTGGNRIIHAFCRRDGEHDATRTAWSLHVAGDCF